MSALRIPVCVMQTLTVPTVKVLTAVLVNKDSLEMEQFVKVCENNVEIRCSVSSFRQSGRIKPIPLKTKST